jgi:hypothetical protein
VFCFVVEHECCIQTRITFVNDVPALFSTVFHIVIIIIIIIIIEWFEEQQYIHRRCTRCFCHARFPNERATRVKSNARGTRISRDGKDGETGTKSNARVQTKKERNESDSTTQRTFFSNPQNDRCDRRVVARSRRNERFQRTRVRERVFGLAKSGEGVTRERDCERGDDESVDERKTVGRGWDIETVGKERVERV